MEYDEYTGDYFACVYPGAKPQFPNYKMFFIDGKKKAEWKALKGKGIEGWELSLRKAGVEQTGETGNYFPYGSMGMYSLGDGRFYFIEPVCNDEYVLLKKPNNAAFAVLYKLNETKDEWSFEQIDS